MGETDIDHILYISIVVYILIMTTLVIAKPRMVYDNKNKKLRSFGYDEHETLFALPVLSILLSIFVYITILSYKFLLSKLE
jgi:hypothetical protein